MRPSRRIRQVLHQPQQQHRGDDPELTGNHHEHEAAGPALIQSLDLMRRQSLFFYREEDISHVSLLSEYSYATLNSTKSHVPDSSVVPPASAPLPREHPQASRSSSVSPARTAAQSAAGSCSVFLPPRPMPPCAAVSSSLA